jgi:hypothetical protein
MSAKMEMIDAYFEDLQDKADFARNLYDSGRRDESLVLCCAYISALANHLYGGEKQDRLNFSRILVEHGKQEELALVHPRPLLDALRGCGATRIANVLESHLSLSPPELVSGPDLERLLKRAEEADDKVPIEGRIIIGSARRSL